MQEVVERTRLLEVMEDFSITQSALLVYVNRLASEELSKEAISLYPGKSKSAKESRSEYILDRKSVTGLTRKTIYNIIYGKNTNGISHRSAYLILRSINDLRRGKSSIGDLALEDLDLSLYRRWGR
jgi:hypothetical protein